MSGKGISRNIPAARRWHLLERAAEISRWPGYREIRAAQQKRGTRITYDGQGGYICLQIDNDDDFESRLAAIDRLLEHDREIARIEASLNTDALACDYCPTNDTWVENDSPLPLWAWTVPEEMALAMSADKPEGIRDWITRAVHEANGGGIDEREAIGNYQIQFRGNPHSQNGRARIVLFAVDTGGIRLSWNSGGRYLRLKEGDLPETALAFLERNRPLRGVIEHPLLHPETVVKYATRSKGAVHIEMWRQASVLEPAPLQRLEDVLHAHEEAQRKLAR